MSPELKVLPAVSVSRALPAPWRSLPSCCWQSAWASRPELPLTVLHVPLRRPRRPKAGTVAVASVIGATAPAQADAASIARGRYIVAISGCNDCHTAGYSETGGKVAQSDWLLGQPVGFRGPWGVSYPANLRLTVQSMTEVEWLRFARVERLPPMPWFALRDMGDDDLRSMYRFVRSLGAKGARMRRRWRRTPTSVRRTSSSHRRTCRRCRRPRRRRNRAGGVNPRLSSGTPGAELAVCAVTIVSRCRKSQWETQWDSRWRSAAHRPRGSLCAPCLRHRTRPGR